MVLLLERFILGGSFFLLLIFGTILLLLKNNFVQSLKLHRYLGASIILTGCSLLCMYLEVISPDDISYDIVKIAIGLASVLVYAYMGYEIISLLSRKYRMVLASDSQEPQQEVEKKPAERQEVPVETQTEKPAPVETEETETAEEEPVEEEVEEEETDDTDEDGNAVPEPSVDNMEDLIFFQKLEAMMARKKLFSEQDVTREQIAAEIGTNRTYLIRSIKLATGMTFNEYLTSLRVNYAATLLITTDEPLEYIGTIAGFRSKSAYYRAFTAANDCTPTEYRNRNKEK